MMPQITIRTELGEVIIDLATDRAPRTCSYFQSLIMDGEFADASIFRVVAERNRRDNERCPIDVIQLGPRGCMSGQRHPLQHEGTNQTGLVHKKWAVSAARVNLNELFASFFICMRDAPELDYGGARHDDGQGFSAFGQVRSGFSVLEAVMQRAEDDEWLKNEILICSMGVYWH